ncbi:hypothetical protein BDF21DRAFT_497493 [Thamnidium elegans]|nr:hypothetical protein BDF21DRAFT_497493 [Thamnidium elegans]
MNTSDIFIEKFKRSIIINFIIENNIKNININYDKNKYEIYFSIAEDNKEDTINTDSYDTDSTSDDSKTDDHNDMTHLIDGDTNNLKTNGEDDLKTNGEDDLKTNDIKLKTNDENIDEELINSIKGNLEIDEDCILEKDENEIHHQPKHKRNNNLSDIEDIPFCINMFINEELNLNLFTKDENCLLLLKNLLIFEKKLVEKKDTFITCINFSN